MDKLKTVETIYLDKEESENLYKVLQNPPKPNKALVDLMKDISWNTISIKENK